MPIVEQIESDSEAESKPKAKEEKVSFAEEMIKGNINFTKKLSSTNLSEKRRQTVNPADLHGTLKQMLFKDPNDKKRRRSSTKLQDKYMQDLESAEHLDSKFKSRRK